MRFFSLLMLHLQRDVESLCECIKRILFFDFSIASLPQNDTVSHSSINNPYFHQ